ncbi:MAG: hypothetical protein PHU27_07535 [Salinivirgaceae bacterium]|nr:hypothetical protein [Salinivirgaceae bacterium]MDD4747853.1 hypothetical protein [Salinivirgaceae bacterium]MDY0280282.1 hypothetical protein [Salinivirgaceae bacterium]
MNQVAFLIAVTAVAFVIGRSIRDMLRKRPVREKKARRKILYRLFAISALIITILLFIVISTVGTIISFTEGIELDKTILLILILGISGYLSYEIVKYLKNL